MKNSYHNLFYLIEELNNSDLARYNDTLYKKLKLKGYETYAWEPSKIKNDYGKCTEKLNDQWKNMNLDKILNLQLIIL